ncbi:MAG: ABC transporter ATP-binding protein [Acidobacteria bacterium]|nr:ABC transporter ATP-binding protein [Acidobacteriota bacterium]
MEEEVSSTQFDRRLLVRLLSLALPYWRTVLVALACLLANSVLQVLTPLLAKIAVDRYLAPSTEHNLPWLEQWLSAAPREGLIQISLIYLTAILVGLMADFGQQLLMQWTGQRAMFDLRSRLLAHTQRLDIRFFDKSPVGRLVTRLTTDVDALNELFASGIVTLLGDVLVLLFILAAMFRLSPPLTLISMGILPLVFAVTIVFRRSVASSNRKIRVAVARINSFLQEHVNGMAVLQLFNREQRATGDFDKVNHQHVVAYRGAIRAYGWFYPVVELLSMLVMCGLLSYGGIQVRGGGLTLGVLVAFFQYGMRVFRPIQDLSEKYNILQSALAAAERVFALLDQRVDVQAPAHPAHPPLNGSEIEFDGVWFAYNDEDWVLRDVSFRIAPGEVIAVVGHTGAGKTTLSNLLLRFYDVQKGAIRIGGVDIRDFDPRDLRRHFGVVLQDPHLFTGTIGGNIRLGSTKLDDGALELAAEQVNLIDFVRELPQGFDHPVLERGTGLSTGQKQLIGFARALAHNPSCLILDEATSSVDTETEIKVREALERMVEGRTSIIIAHRLSTIQRADRILVLHKGKLRETGTHQELLAARGIYWKLYQLQYKDQETRRK